MDGDENIRLSRGMQDMAAIPHDLDLRAEQRGDRCRAERDDQFRFQKFELGAEPPGATLHFSGVGPRVQTFLAAHLVFEMLDRIGDVAPIPIDTRFVKALIQELAGRPNERPPGQILPVTGLFADKHDVGRTGAFAKNKMGGVAIEIAPCTGLSIVAQFSERIRVRMFIRQ